MGGAVLQRHPGDGRHLGPGHERHARGRIEASHNRVQHELRPARAVLVRGEIQRATDGHPGGRRIFAEAATCLQAGAGAQYYVGRVKQQKVKKKTRGKTTLAREGKTKENK